MDEEFYLKYCRQLLAKKLGAANFEIWKDQDFQRLSDTLFLHSKTRLSVNTLKRFFGKIQTTTNYNPQLATKITLAVYLGYRNWDHFVAETRKMGLSTNNHEDQLQPAIQSNQIYQRNGSFLNGVKKLHRVGLSTLLFAGLACICFIVYFAFFYKSQPETFEFDSQNTCGKMPHTVSFNYDISKLDNDSVFIDYDYYHQSLKYQKFPLSKVHHTINHCFQIPYQYKVKLLNGSIVLKQIPVLILSDGWVGYIHSDKPHKESEYYNIFLHTTEKMFRDSVADNMLYINPKSIINQGFNQKATYYIDYIKTDTFQIDGDNFEYVARIKNPSMTGGISCYDTFVQIFGEHGFHELVFMENGCQRWARLHFSELELKGENDDLSFLTADLSDWREVKIRIENKKLKVCLDDTVIYEASYQNPVGKVRMLGFRFKGSGAVDYLKVSNLSGNIIYSDDFN